MSNTSLQKLKPQGVDGGFLGARDSFFGESIWGLRQLEVVVVWLFGGN